MDLFGARDSLSQDIYPTNMRIHLRLSLILMVLAACNRGGAPGPAGAGRGGAPPATGVTIVTLKMSPIEVSSDFISTVRSLHSTSIQSQVDGRVTKIYVKSA